MASTKNSGASCRVLAPARVFLVDERGTPLGAIAEMVSTFLYRYDFGDDWEHDVIVKGVVSKGERDIVCAAGARA